jgi:hypothetical protein
MHTSLPMALAASRIGTTARRLLEPGAALRLNAAFSGAAHFTTPGGELLVLADGEVVAPWAVLVPGLPWAELARASQARLIISADDPARLRLAGLVIALEHADPWASPPLGPAAPAEQIGAAVARSGLPVAAPGLAGCAAESLVRALGDSLGRGEPGAIAAACAPLVGLGRGLTPAGDDLVTGALGALALAGRPAPAPPLAGRTTLLGATQLAHAATGALVEPLHAVVAAVLAGEPAPPAEVTRMLGLGHSSGADMLAGARLALAALSGRRPER